uniref:AAA domain-containing protein n=1 Tax=Caenorhabditis tropicalis TaxID=1561998 RepID=A0A1I7TF03_9PELO
MNWCRNEPCGYIERIRHQRPFRTQRRRAVEEKQKANNNTNNSKKNKQQQNQKKDQKVVEKSGEEGKNKSPQTGGKKMDDVADAASVTKRCSSGVGQQSEEDDDQSYVSAQENLGGSNGSLSPNEFVDAQSREEVTDNVMSDPNNYRNDEDVPSLAQELHQRDLEFITVGKKKNKKQTSVQDNDFHSSTESSSSPTNRRNTHPDARVSSITGNSASGSNQHQKKNIPSAPLHTFGDFCDIDKGIGKNKKASGPSPCSSQKKHASVDKSEPLEFVDAPETPMTINTAHTFSYADAAKKSSGENTPALDMSPIPQSATNSSASSVRNQASQSHAQSGSASNEKKKNTEKTPSRGAPSNKPSATIASGAVQLPPSVVGAVSDISFGYEETPEDVKKRQQKETKTAAAPQRPPKQTRMNGVDLLKSFTQQPENSGSKKETTLNEMPKNGLSEEHVLAAEILSAWQIRWDEFNTGKKKISEPVVFKPAKTEKKSSPPPRQ